MPRKPKELPDYFTPEEADALVLAGTGEEPEWPAQTALGLRQQQAEDEAVRRACFVALYYTHQGFLHGHCFDRASATPWRTPSAGSGGGRPCRGCSAAGGRPAESVT